MAKGNISVQAENIFPIIKKFLYSDQEIFLRELVSNAVDATTKIKTIVSKGDKDLELGDLTVHVKLDKEAKTLTISDRGIGMSESEVIKYLTEVAFSSAEDFLKKYEDEAAIIGHFGLGFYSAFMVADKVEVITRSHKKSVKAVKWTCEGDPAYDIENTTKKDRGTDIVLHISDDATEYLEESKIAELLDKYCKFLPIPIQFGTKTDISYEGEGEDRKEIKTEVPNVVNNPTPAWKKKPAKLKDEDYQALYKELYPFSQPPLFWIHLNIDFPFNLTGVLYFPKLNNSMEVQKNKIHLYSNQVYVTDDVQNIVPEFLMLLHGVIDSPDIPLNVSRSYLQADANVKKITTYITKKVADTIEEYKEAIKDNQTDKHDKTIMIYSNNAKEQHSYIQSCKNYGYNVLEMDTVIDNHYMQHLESKGTGVTFVRVDSDTPDNLIQKDEVKESVLMKEMQAMQGMDMGMLPDSHNVVINTNHELIANKLLRMKAGEKKDRFASYLHRLAMLNQKLQIVLIVWL